LHATDHRRRAHAALDRAHDWLALRERHIDALAAFRTRHHAWIEGRCLLMAAVAIQAAVEYRHMSRACRE
jgi:hypothetical protein